LLTLSFSKQLLIFVHDKLHYISSNILSKQKHPRGVFDFYLDKYFSATLNAKEGNITKTVANRSLVKIKPRTDLVPSPSGNSKIINIPTIPKVIDE